MKKPEYKFYKTSVLGVSVEQKPFQSLAHLGLPPVETFIVELMLNDESRGCTNVRQVQMALNRGDIQFSEDLVRHYFVALEKLGLVVIHKPKGTDWEPVGWWWITFPGFLRRTCECCGELGNFYPPWPPATFKPPVAPVAQEPPPRKRGRPVRSSSTSQPAL